MAGQGADLDGRAEQDLLSRAAAGEAAAFDRLVSLHEPAVRRLAHRLLGWRDGEVDDVVQDVFLTLLKRLSSFRGQARLSTWLAAVTLNRCRTHRRRQWTRLRWLRAQRLVPPDQSDGIGTMAEETSATVQRAVRELKPADREVIVLFYLEQLPIAEIAALLGARTNAIEVRLHRARQRLKARLMELGVADAS
jgi:RNA polymerase sigma-70 factor (ECF subfamily)